MLLLISIVLLVGVATDFFSPTPLAVDEPLVVVESFMTGENAAQSMVTSTLTVPIEAPVAVDSRTIVATAISGTSMLVLTLAYIRHRRMVARLGRNTSPAPTPKVRFPLRCILPA